MIKIHVPLYVKKFNFFGLRKLSSRISVLRGEFHKTFKKLAFRAYIYIYIYIYIYRK